MIEIIYLNYKILYELFFIFLKFRKPLGLKGLTEL